MNYKCNDFRVHNTFQELQVQETGVGIKYILFCFLKISKGNHPRQTQLKLKLKLKFISIINKSLPNYVITYF